MSPKFVNDNKNLIKLIRRFEELGSAVVAFSGGVDSALLVAASHLVLGNEKMVAITVDSHSLPDDDRKRVARFCSDLSIPHEFVAGTEFEDEKFLSNSSDRCYFCKKHLYSLLMNVAERYNFKYVVEGTNSSDMTGHRPGAKAAFEFERVVQPLKELGLDKAEVRKLAKALNLKEADKPATACLSSRIPFGTKISHERLLLVDKAESYLKQLGIKKVRVRDHDKIARIEVDDESFAIVLNQREEILKMLAALGWHHITLDLGGYSPAIPHKE
ncbi:MAG: ATP-dependent sacrificial sulfur transferase LarE [Pseudomonadota bacterium]